VGAREAGCDCDRALQEPHGLVSVAEVVEDAAKVVQVIGRVGIGNRGGVKLGTGLLESALGEVPHTEVVVDQAQIGAATGKKNAANGSNTVRTFKAKKS